MLIAQCNGQLINMNVSIVNEANTLCFTAVGMPVLCWRLFTHLCVSFYLNLNQTLSVWQDVQYRSVATGVATHFDRTETVFDEGTYLAQHLLGFLLKQVVINIWRSFMNISVQIPSDIISHFMQMVPAGSDKPSVTEWKVICFHFNYVSKTTAKYGEQIQITLLIFCNILLWTTPLPISHAVFCSHFLS